MAADGAFELEGFARSLVAGDEAAIRTFLADDYFGHVRQPDEPSQADRWVQLLPDVRAAMPDLAIDIEPLDDAGAGPDEAHVRAVVTATHTGELWGSPGTGKPVRAELRITARRTGGGWVLNADDPPPAMIGALRAIGVIPPADAMHVPPEDPIAPPEFLLKLGFTGQAADKPCSHLAEARVFEPSTDVCAECVAMDSYWPALRMCLACGNVACCDTSLNKHARMHAQATGHHLMRSVRLAEAWIWCYEDGAFFERTVLERLAAGRDGGGA